MNRPRGASDLPRNTRAWPSPTQVVPIRVSKPEVKMEPAGIQVSTVSATPGSVDSHELPHFRFGGSHVSRPHFRFSGSHVTQPYFRYVVFM